MHLNEGRTDRLCGPLQTETVQPTLYRKISLLNPGPERTKTSLKQVKVQEDTVSFLNFIFCWSCGGAHVTKIALIRKVYTSI